MLNNYNLVCIIINLKKKKMIKDVLSFNEPFSKRIRSILK